ncbi:hypothetical protein TEA_018109 [Camellia sinensis var. sinensis]|uniref:Cathepsin propeptide inhibitor domain-containing protein n=1 Tax=Camellia sinensis var. sinensis TaxID=542762 RepID=A0A4S4DBU6_CAMSN|nr:hypothetical protein TEA_018109 [Camellia sinensis var. sinensis]
MDLNKCFLVVLSLALVLRLGESSDFHEKELETEERLWDLDKQWRSHHTVSRSLDAKHNQFSVFKYNVHHVHNANKKDKPYKLMLNKFADMTNHKFKSTYASSNVKHHRMLWGSPKGNGSFMYEKVDTVPPSIDWRKKGAITRVKDQGQCGCNGGLMDLAFKFIKQKRGITTKENYPYNTADGTYGFSKGVFTRGCGTELDRGVAIVGYGTTLDGTKYWIVKNSWGTEWVEKGYIRMQQGISDKGLWYSNGGFVSNQVPLKQP